VAGELLLDTGPLVSLLDRTQRHHEACLAVLEDWPGELVTTEAVLTEASHLLARVPGGAVLCLEFVLRGGAVVAPTSPTALERACELMRKYAEIPMDYADATLVVLAEELGTLDVFTLDRRGFATYRARRSRAFRIHPT